MADEVRAECRKVSWWIAIAAGLLVMLMLWLVAKAALLTALLIGAALAVALGYFLGWAFCAKAGEARPAETPAPAPEAAPPAAAGPSPILVPRPDAAPGGAVAAVVPAVEPVPAKARAPSRTAAARKAGAARAAPAKPAPARKAAAGLDAALAKSKDEPASGAPELLDAPRGGRADDLKMIRGVGPKLEALLNSVGVWHFDQIAGWKARNIAFVDERMEGFKGRITRDEWVKQAKVLARGGKTEFSERVRKGDVYRSVNEGT